MSVKKTDSLWEDIDALEALQSQETDHSDVTDHLRTVTWHISSSSLWVLAGLGIPGNVFIVLTIVRMRILSPATFFITCLAICDGAALTFKLVQFLFTRFDLPANTALCVLKCVPAYFATLANWMLVLICFERFISVCYPLQKASILTKRRCYMAAGGVAGVLMVLFVSFYGVIRQHDDFLRDGRSATVCRSKTKAYNHIWNNIWIPLNVTLYTFLPFMFIFALTIKIVYSLSMTKRRRRDLIRKGSRKSHTEAEERLMRKTERLERMITVMLIVASLFFLVTSLPISVYNIHAYFEESDNETSYGVKEAQWKLFYQISKTLVDSSHALNFFLYFFIAQRFRSSALGLFCKRCVQPNYVDRESDKNASQDSKMTSARSILNLASQKVQNISA